MTLLSLTFELEHKNPHIWQHFEKEVLVQAPGWISKLSTSTPFAGILNTSDGLLSSIVNDP